MPVLLGVVGESSLPESDVQSSSSEGWMPRWCDLLWCLTMVVLRQKLGEDRQYGFPQSRQQGSSEPLQAPVMSAFVRALARVDPPMPSEGGRLCRCQYSVPVVALRS
jgi:hypothetical protein